MPVRLGRRGRPVIGLLPALMDREHGRTPCLYSADMNLLRILVLTRGTSGAGHLLEEVNRPAKSPPKDGDEGDEYVDEFDGAGHAIPSVVVNGASVEIDGYMKSEYNQGSLYLENKRACLSLSCGTVSLKYTISRKRCERCERAVLFTDQHFHTRLSSSANGRPQREWPAPFSTEGALWKDQLPCTSCGFTNCSTCPSMLIIRRTTIGSCALQLVNSLTGVTTQELSLPEGWAFTSISLWNDTSPVVSLTSELKACTKADLEAAADSQGGGHTPCCMVLLVSYADSRLRVCDQFVVTYQAVKASCYQLDRVVAEEGVALVVFRSGLVKAYNIEDFRCNAFSNGGDNSLESTHLRPAVAHPKTLFELKSFDGNMVFSGTPLLCLYQCPQNPDKHYIMDVRKKTLVGEVDGPDDCVGSPDIGFDDAAPARLKKVTADCVVMYKLFPINGSLAGLETLKTIHFGMRKKARKPYSRAGRRIRSASYGDTESIPIIISMLYDDELKLYCVVWHRMLGLRVTLIDGETFTRLKDIHLPVNLSSDEVWHHKVNAWFDRNLLIIQRHKQHKYKVHVFDLVDLDRRQSKSHASQLTEILNDDPRNGSVIRS